MLRSHNLVSTFINTSNCYFRWGSNNKNATNENFNTIMQEISDHNGIFSMNSNCNESWLKFPHAEGDAFTGLSLISEISNDFCSIHGDGEDLYELNDTFFYCHFTKEGKMSFPSSSSFTQFLILRMKHIFLVQSVEQICFAVSLDDLAKISKPYRWGNSLILIDFSFDQILNKVNQDKETWIKDLQNRAERLAQIYSKKNNLKPKNDNKNTVLISSIGSIDKLNWAPKITPRQLHMVPTPPDFNPNYTNFIFWSGQGVSSFSICAPKNHWSIHNRKLLKVLWESMFEVKND